MFHVCKASTFYLSTHSMNFVITTLKKWRSKGRRMATFNDLPAELLLEILAHTDLPTTHLWRFLGISKVIYSKIALLAHRKELGDLCRELNFCHLPHSDCLRKFRSFLRTISRREDLAPMVRSVVLASGWRTDTHGLYERTRTGRCNGDEKRLLEAGYRVGFSPDSPNCKDPKNRHKQSNLRAWRAFNWGIQSNHLGAELILLFAMLPNLESLTIDIQEQPSGLPWDRLLTSNTCSLANLKNLTLFGHPQQGGSMPKGITDLSFLLGLPSLTSLRLCDLNWTSEGHLLPSHRPLNITSLILDNCSMSASTFGILSSRIPALKSFSFIIRNLSSNHKHLSMATLATFINSHSSTLEYLHVNISSLLGDNAFHRALGSLASCVSLKSLDISPQTLLGNHKFWSRGHRMEEYMPPSLEVLRIRKPIPDYLYRAINSFAMSLATHPDRYSNFKTFILPHDVYWSFPEMEMVGITVARSK